MVAADGYVKARWGIKRLLKGGFPFGTFREALKALKAAGDLVVVQADDRYYWARPDAVLPAHLWPKKKAVAFLKELLKPGSVRATDGMRFFMEAGFTRSLFYAVRDEAGVRLTQVGKLGADCFYVWHLEGSDPLPVREFPPPTVTAEADADASKYSGHTKKPTWTGRPAEELREVVIEFYYDLYIGLGFSQSAVLTSARKHFGPAVEKYLEKGKVRAYAREWAGRWAPRLPLVRGWMRELVVR
jgi:hypothetical protein